MPVSETYFLQWLVNGTTAEPPELQWRQTGPAGYSTTVAGVRLKLRLVSELTASRLVLELDDSLYEISIVQPRIEGFFRRRFGSEHESYLAQLFQQLFAAVSRQVVRRQMTALEMEEAVRERMFRRVLFHECSPVVALGQVSP
jgi:hypothetical protein